MIDDRTWWLFVLGDQEGVDWVREENRMAFVTPVCRRAAKIEPGDRAFLYLTKKILKDVGRVTALVEITGPVTSEQLRVGSGLYFACWCPLKFLHQVESHNSVAIAPLVAELEFVRKKDQWSHYLRSAVVKLPAADGLLIENRLRAAPAAGTAASAP